LDEVAQSAPEISEDKDMAGSKLPEAGFATIPFRIILRRIIYYSKEEHFTNFGMSKFEKVACILRRNDFPFEQTWHGSKSILLESCFIFCGIIWQMQTAMMERSACHFFTSHSTLGI
jgi:hypothetical protein